jgi:hypothetical protein
MPPAARVLPVVVSLVLLSRAGPAPAVEPPDGAAALGPAPSALPPLPEGVTALQFGEFFVKPVGPRGLVLTEKIRGLDGRRVRILGYMVRRDAAPPGTLLLAPYPVQLHDHEYGLADDLPPATLVVVVPGETGELPHTTGPLLLTGRLELGSREEPDGRVSTARLVLDPRPAGQALPLPRVERKPDAP